MFKKYDLPGFGKVQALLVFTAMASGPLAFLTTGIPGKIVFPLLELAGEWLASKGLVLLNIGAEKVETLIEENAYDGSFEKAFEAINAKRGKLTDAEKKSIDDKVIAAARKFFSFSVRDSQNP